MTQKITPEYVRELREKITPGEWIAESYESPNKEWLSRVKAIEDRNYLTEVTYIVDTQGIGGNISDQMADTNFIAAAPAIADAYVEKCEALEKHKKYLRFLHQEMAALEEDVKTDKAENTRLQSIIDNTTDALHIELRELEKNLKSSDHYIKSTAHQNNQLCKAIETGSNVFKQLEEENARLQSIIAQQREALKDIAFAKIEPDVSAVNLQAENSRLREGFVKIKEYYEPGPGGVSTKCYMDDWKGMANAMYQTARDALNALQEDSWLKRQVDKIKDHPLEIPEWMKKSSGENAKLYSPYRNAPQERKGDARQEITEQEIYSDELLAALAVFEWLKVTGFKVVKSTPSSTAGKDK